MLQDIPLTQIVTSFSMFTVHVLLRATLLGEAAIAFYTLFLLEHAAADDAEGEEQHCHGNRCNCDGRHYWDPVTVRRMTMQWSVLKVQLYLQSTGLLLLTC